MDKESNLSSSNDENAITKLSWWVWLVSSIICLVSFIYAFMIILRKPETRGSLLLLSNTCFHTIGVSVIIANLLLYQGESGILFDVAACALNMANWIFQIHLLNTALMLPLIFGDTKSLDETQEVTTAKLERKAKNVKRFINTLLPMPFIIVVLVAIIFGRDAVFLVATA